MDWRAFLLLAGAGVLGGIINALAGGATLITFPVMLAVGLPPVIANASNAVAIAPGHLLATLADRRKLPRFGMRLVWLGLAAGLGGAAGAIILLALPPRLFILPVPALIAFATLLFAFAPSIQAWSRRSPRGLVSSSDTRGGLLIAVASVYGGFFGAGLGVILTAVVSITDPGDIRTIKVLKNLLASFVSIAAIIIFVAKGMVQWRETIYMLIGALLGGYLGGHLIRVLPAVVVRWFVLVAGTVMTAIYAAQYWF
ncbi:sulfite exporter TauE/SafE family protein [Robbsia sp. Bb-Pol-6]|uniref:Probable membrane transporter protein n=1 Tax=Robbsia betulipollinis TaxID=2981849 RepID=A0ABT3ZQZ4_9BURK|nr:sulfite exporter TauE/SafE family protein [Robbsia betulipollinis]MCY0388973.1 sulfite exporter TauE/SafE family protein [Robbsia betulipollinis]